jgi:phage baseplate assembly protein W
MPYKNLEIGSTKLAASQAVQQTQFYKGFSTVNNPNPGNRLFDFALIQQDIINHFNTRKGERVMNPNFGSIIWDLLMEPLDASTRQLLKDDIQTICTSDPRVVPTQIDLTEYDQGYLLELTLQLVGTDQTSNLKLNFNQSLGLTVQATQ